MNIKDQKEFPVDSAQLKEVRNFARGLFDQVPLTSHLQLITLGAKPRAQRAMSFTEFQR